MDWSQHSIPAMRLEPRFGDRVVPAFCERPRSIPAMLAEAVAANPDGEALVCGDRRMTWREVALQSAKVAAGRTRWAASAVGLAITCDWSRKSSFARSSK